MNIQNIIQDSLPYLSHYGLLFVFAGALIEGETIILLAGVLCHQGLLPLNWTIIAAATGAFIGDQLWFYLGRRHGKNILLRFPKMIIYADKIRPWLKQKSDWIAMSSRFVYGTRTVAPLLLGLHHYPAIRFILINSISASIWALVVVGAGYLIGTGAEQLFGRLKHIEQLLLAIVIIMLVWRWYRRRKKKNINIYP